MAKELVERRHGSFCLIGSRVPLARIVRGFQNGESPESIRSHFPTLTLEQVYGAITEELVLIWSATEPEEWTNSILRIPKTS